MSEQLLNNDLSVGLDFIHASIRNNGFSEHTLRLIDDYINDILNGKTDLTQFNQAEHAGLCCAGEMLIGAYIVCNYARTSLEASADVATGQRSLANWEVDEAQEKMVQQWAESKHIWFAHAEQDIESEYGSMIAQGAEAKVFLYRLYREIYQEIILWMSTRFFMALCLS